MIFMKHRNLEKAVVLSLILSMGVYGTGFAQELNTKIQQADIKIDLTGEDLVIKTNESALAYDGVVDIKKDYNGNGGNLVIEASGAGSNGIEAGYMTDKMAELQIYASNVNITSGANGLFTNYDKGGTIILGSEDRQIEGLTINSGGQGIDNKKGNVYIYGADDSVIDISTTAQSGLFFGYFAAVHNEKIGGEIEINGDRISLSASNNSDGINSIHGTTTLNSNSVTINTSRHGIYTEEESIVSLNTKGSNNISALDDGSGVYALGRGTINIIASENYDANIGNDSLKVQDGYDNNIYSSYYHGIINVDNGTTNVIADNNNIIAGKSSAVSIYGDYSNDPENSIINIVAGGNNIFGLATDEYGTYVHGGNVRINNAYNSEINITSITGDTQIYGWSGSGISIAGGENNKVKVQSGDDIYIEMEGNGVTNGGTNSTVDLIANNGNNTIISNVIGVGHVNGPYVGVKSGRENSKIKLDAINNTVEIYRDKEDSGDAGISADRNGEVSLEADGTNQILANMSETLTRDEAGDYGDKYAVNVQRGGTINVKAGLANTVYGAVYATGENSTVDISKLEQTGTTFSRNAAGDVNNFVRSAAVIDKAGDLDGKEIIENGDGTVTTTGMDVVSALYAEEGAKINLSGVNNIQTYYDDPSDEHTSERAVWAYKGADITIDGVTNISTSKYAISPENRDIAIAAGTATKLEEKDFIDYEKKVEIANVNLNYKAGSAINGDILAAYGGVVNITDANAASRDVNGGAGTGIAITGDLLAGNNGKLTVDLGNSGVLIGRADDYGDAELDNGHGSGDEDGFYNPAFSSNILHGGEVTLNMGNGSLWSVQGQSWITNLNTNGNVLIDLTNASTEYESNAHALTVRNLNGDANIKMSLNGDRTQSDMLYIGNGNGTYNIELDEVVYVDDMYADSGEGFKFSGLRFATVGKGSDVDFNVTATDKGFNNIIYTVGKDVYGSNVSNHENDAYNNGDGTSLDKPGNAAVEDLLKDAEQAGAATINTNDIMLLANEPDTGENLDNNENHLNYKLIDMQTVRSDAGETMLNMSRANYSNAIYMDRLNKRLGEARYINDDPEEDEGMWVRVRHDRIGKDEAFRSQNTMYELGYDKRQECDNGKRRVGFAVDYMHGDTGYNDIAGKGEIDRYGLWLYDTWTGNKGHYVDYVAKWGHLQNDFEVYNSEGKVTGDYSNNVFSISAEYGRKKDMGNDWYFEPQAQLQLARVTGADYTTSQGTKVSVDGINSLIGRAGFRIGKDFGEEKQSTLYFKADVLHEFLGDQTIRALDGTTNGWQSVDYENQGTWYDIGIGYAAMLSQSTYAFIDLEQSFGNDNDDTYQINAGVRWTF